MRNRSVEKNVVQSKTLPLIITLFTVVILFILCAGKSRLYFPVGKEREDTNFLFLLFFRRSLPSEVF